MNKILRSIVIGISLAGILLAGCQSKPADVAEKAATIAEFSVPEGYQPELGVDLAGYTVVSYNPGDGHSHLYLVQSRNDKDLTPEKMEELLSQAQPGSQAEPWQKDRTTRLTVVETRPATIRGQATTLVISEGTNGEGDPYRQLTTAFQGKGGPALLVLEEPVDRWDDARMDRLIASIK